MTNVDRVFTRTHSKNSTGIFQEKLSVAFKKEGWIQGRRFGGLTAKKIKELKYQNLFRRTCDFF